MTEAAGFIAPKECRSRHAAQRSRLGVVRRRVAFGSGDSIPEHLATFIKNAYGHEAVMVHIPTDWQSGVTYGHAYAEFETPQAAQDVCERALSMAPEHGPGTPNTC